MRERFMQQLEKLKMEIRHMGELIQTAIEGTVIALHSLDKEKAKEIIQSDEVIDQMEKEIESDCLHILLQQTPVASDLRQISGALKMITDLERIGDHASDISEMILILDSVRCEKIRDYLEQMAKITSKMVIDSIDAYVKMDLELAKSVIASDDHVDQLFLSTKEAIADEMNTGEEEDGMQALDLLMIAKYFERIGDHAENVGEWVVFAITGEHKDERVI